MKVAPFTRRLEPQKIVGFLNTHRWIFGITFVAFIVRLAWLLYAQPVPISDFQQYLDAARNLVEHGQYGYPEPTAYRLPFYPVVLAGLSLISSSVGWLSLCSVVLSASMCVLVYASSRRVEVPRGTGYVAAGICAVYPQFVFFSPVLASEHLLVVLLLVAFLLGTSVGIPRFLRFSLSGLVVGAAVLTRGDAALYGMIVLASSFLASREGDETRAWSVQAGQVAAFGAAMLIAVSPWIIRNHIVMGPGTGLGGNSGQVFWYGHNPQGYGFVPLGETPMAGLGERETQERAWELALDYIRENPTPRCRPR